MMISSLILPSYNLLTAVKAREKGTNFAREMRPYPPGSTSDSANSLSMGRPSSYGEVCVYY